MLCKSTAQHKGTMLRTCVRALYKTGQAGLNFQHARGRPVAVSLVKDCCLNSLQPAVLSKSMRSRRLESRVYARLINANVRKRGGETWKSKREKKRKKKCVVDVSTTINGWNKASQTLQVIHGFTQRPTNGLKPGESPQQHVGAFSYMFFIGKWIKFATILRDFTHPRRMINLTEHPSRTER